MVDAQEFESRVRDRLAAFRPRELTSPGSTFAAVCVAVVIRAGVPVVLMEQRAATLRKHAGQFALPGGRLDPGETAAQAALREMAEEIGIHADPSRIVGRLDDFATRSGYVMSPFVVWVGEYDAPFECNPAEVDTLHLITMPELDAEPRFVRQDGLADPVFQWPYLGGFIHAPTAAILHQFREVALHGRHTPVAHFEQPNFAWR